MITITEAVDIAAAQQPYLEVTNVSEAEDAWFFSFDFPGVYPGRPTPGQPQIMVAKNDGSWQYFVVDTPDFWHYMPIKQKVTNLPFILLYLLK